MKYVTIINERRFEIEVDNEGRVLIDGEERDVDFLNLGGSLYSLITENKSFEAVIDDDEGRIDVMMRGRLFEAQVLDERAMLLMQRRGGMVDSSGEVHAPMPGLIVDVTVEVGEAVAKGQTVVILESMKMQNELKSPVAGVVRAKHAQAGQAVDKNDLLVEIKPLASEE